MDEEILAGRPALAHERSDACKSHEIDFLVNRLPRRVAEADLKCAAGKARQAREAGDGKLWIGVVVVNVLQGEGDLFVGNREPVIRPCRTISARCMSMTSISARR